MNQTSVVNIFILVSTILFLATAGQAEDSLLLVNSATNKKINIISDKKKVSFSSIQEKMVTLKVIPTKKEKNKIKSFTIKLRGALTATSTESTAPYCLLGNSGKQCNRGMRFKSGAYRVKVIKKFKDSSVKNKVRLVRFTVAEKTTGDNPSPTPTVPSILPTPPTGDSQFDFPIPACGKAPCVFPTEQTTGVKDRSILRKVTAAVFSSNDGEIIRDLHIVGKDLTIDDDNVTVENVFIDGGTLKVEEGANNWVVRHVEIYGPNEGNLMVTSRGGSGVAEFIYAHHSSADFLRVGSNQTYRCMFVEKLGMGANSHADVVQVYPGPAKDVLFEFNRFDIPSPSCNKTPGCQPGPAGHRATSIFMDGGAYNQRVQFSCNWLLNGGGYSFYSDKDSKKADSHYITNNLFGCDNQFGFKTGGPWSTTNWYGNINTCNGSVIE